MSRHVVIVYQTTSAVVVLLRTDCVVLLRRNGFVDARTTTIASSAVKITSVKC